MIRDLPSRVNRRAILIVVGATFLIAVAAALLLVIRDRQAENDRPPSRFVTVKAKEANVRAGPGKRYPIRWVYVEPGIPVEILAEYDNWRQIRDWDGQEGWIHVAMLSRKRNVIVTGGKRTLHRKPDAQSSAVVILNPGIIAGLEDCNKDWCRVDVRNNRGWLRRGEFWGVDPDEIID